MNTSQIKKEENQKKNQNFKLKKKVLAIETNMLWNIMQNKMKTIKGRNKCICSNFAVFCDCDETFITNDLNEAAPLIMPYIIPIEQYRIATPCQVVNRCDCLPNCNCSCPCACVYNILYRNI